MKQIAPSSRACLVVTNRCLCYCVTPLARTLSSHMIQGSLKEAWKSACEAIMDGKPLSVFAPKTLHVGRHLYFTQICLLAWASSNQAETGSSSTRFDVTCRFAALHATCLNLHAGSLDPLTIATLLCELCWPGRSAVPQSIKAMSI